LSSSPRQQMDGRTRCAAFEPTTPIASTRRHGARRGHGADGDRPRRRLPRVAVPGAVGARSGHLDTVRRGWDDRRRARPTPRLRPSPRSRGWMVRAVCLGRFVADALTASSTAASTTRPWPVVALSVARYRTSKRIAATSAMGAKSQLRPSPGGAWPSSLGHRTPVQDAPLPTFAEPTSIVRYASAMSARAQRVSAEPSFGAGAFDDDLCGVLAIASTAREAQGTWGRPRGRRLERFRTPKSDIASAQQRPGGTGT
jgi:hypothetical protein